MYVPLDLAKKHLNIEEDFKEDDEYILSLVEVAEAAVRVHVNESFADIAKRYGGCIPNPLLHAVLLMVGNLYTNREIVTNKAIELPFNYQYLIDLYRNYNN